MFEVSALQVDDEEAKYVGEELVGVAALAQLPPQLPDTPHDVIVAEEAAAAAPDFAITCQLALKLTGTEESGGKLLNFTTPQGKVTAIVENYAVADVDVIFHDAKEACTSTHMHKVGIDGAAATQKLAATVMEMQEMTKRLDT